ncbi:hypothetical protein ACFLR2_02475, partial [Chlamydiota bacterium]
MAAASVGIVSFGAHQAWWQASAFMQIKQIHALILISAGGGSAFIFLILGIVVSAKSRLNTTRQHHASELARLRGQLQTKSGVLTRAQSRIRALGADVSRLRSICTEYEATLERLSGEEVVLAGQLREAERNLEELRTQLQSKSNELGRLGETQSALQAEGEALRTTLVEKERAVARLSTENRELTSQLLEARARLETALSELEAKNGELIRRRQEGVAGADVDNWALLSVGPREGKRRTEQAWQVFTYDQVAEHKYQVVLQEYRRHLSKDEIQDLLSKARVNGMLNHLHALLQCLMGSDARGPRVCYQALVQELRAVILSPEYQAISAELRDTLSDDNRQIRDFVRKFCLIRWREISLYNYLEQNVLLTIEEDKSPPLSLEDFPETVLAVNERVKRSSRNKKPMIALEGQKLAGALGIEDFCGSKNTPHMRNIQVFRDRDGDVLPITYVRHGTPTALGDNYSTLEIVSRQLASPFVRAWGSELDSGEEVTPDYREYLRALEERDESELFCVYQRRSQDIIENERTRAIKIDGLQETHPNIYVLTQPVEGELFEHKGRYSKMTTFEELKRSLEEEFFETDPDAVTTRAALPLYLRGDRERKEAYRIVFKRLLDDVQTLFFPAQNEALDPSLSASLTDIEEELNRDYREQAATIKTQLREVDLNQLERVEHSTVHEKVLALLLEDVNLSPDLERILKGQIQNLDQLAKWVPVDRAQT